MTKKTVKKTPVKKTKLGRKFMYNVPLKAICCRVAETDREELRKFERELQKKHLIPKVEL